MATNPLDKVYLSKAQLNTIVGGGSITSGSDTYTADESAIYLTDDDSTIVGSSAPTTSTVGYVGQFYIDSTNSKTYQCTAVTTSGNSTTYTWTQLIRITDKGSSSAYGVVKIAQGRGLDFLSDGGLFVDVAGDVQITNRTIGRPLSTERINFAVLSALTDANHLTMTSEQQATAKSVLGISSGSSTDVQVNGTSITSNGVANIVTNTAYNASTNKIATMADVPTITSTQVSIVEVD